VPIACVLEADPVDAGKAQEYPEQKTLRDPIHLAD